MGTRFDPSMDFVQALSNITGLPNVGKHFRMMNLLNDKTEIMALTTDVKTLRNANTQM